MGILESKDDILMRKIPYQKIMGIYFLIEGDEIVYVGQSINCHSRISQHLRTKDFDGYYITPVNNAHDLNTYEARYIVALKPKYNKTLPGKEFVSLKMIAQLFDMKYEEVKEWVKADNIQPVFGNLYSEFDFYETMEPVDA